MIAVRVANSAAAAGEAAVVTGNVTNSDSKFGRAAFAKNAAFVFSPDLSLIKLSTGRLGDSLCPP